MPCQTTSNPVDITRAQIEALGFTFLSQASDVQVYKYQQYTLLYNVLTRKVEVYYGHLDRPMDYAFVSIINSVAELRMFLVRNGVLAA